MVTSTQLVDNDSDVVELHDSEIGNYFLTEDEQHKRFSSFSFHALFVHSRLQIRNLGEELSTFYGRERSAASAAREGKY